jgi:hypothetical protein
MVYVLLIYGCNFSLWSTLAPRFMVSSSDSWLPLPYVSNISEYRTREYQSRNSHNSSLQTPNETDTLTVSCACFVKAASLLLKVQSWEIFLLVMHQRIWIWSSSWQQKQQPTKIGVILQNYPEKGGVKKM